MKYSFLLFAFLLISIGTVSAQTYKIVDTDQTLLYDSISDVPAITSGNPFYGQDAQYNCYQPWYIDNGDGTVTDVNTGLMWQKTPDQDGDGDIDYDDKMSYAEALDSAAGFNLGGYNDWRLPTIKEQYSLILFSGLDPSGYEETSTDGLTPFIDTSYFDFNYGDQAAGERIIDAQFATSTLYVSTTMAGAETMFGVNFADGRIKGYPTGPMPGQTIDKQFYVLFVRGNSAYDVNDLKLHESENREMKHLFVKSENKTVRINLNEIDYIESLNEYVRFHMGPDESVISLMSMKMLEDTLPSNKFMRVHRSFIVNLEKITTIERGRILFHGRTRIPLSDQYRDAFRSYLDSTYQ